MRLTAADRWAVPDGEVSAWRVGLRAGASTTPALLDLSQRNHLEMAARTGSATWLAAAVTVETRLSPRRVESAVRDLLVRHQALRTAGLQGSGGGWVGHEVPAHDLQLTRERCASHTNAHAGATARRVTGLLDEGCRPGGLLPVVPVLIRHEERSTVVVGFDHQHGDAYSVDVVAASLYRALSGECPEWPVREGSHRRLKDTALEPGLALWRKRLASKDFHLPTFPADLDVEPGGSAKQFTHVRSLLGSGDTARLASRARAAGASTFATVLAGLGPAADDLRESRGGGREGLYVLVPVSTRSTKEDLESVRWATTPVPVVLPPRVEGDTEDVIAYALAAAVRAVGEIPTLAAPPLDVALGTLGRPLVQERADLFMLSYVDYTRLPTGGALPTEHVSAATVADDVQLWVARTPRGLDVRARLPDTETARGAVAELLDRWSAYLRAV